MYNAMAINWHVIRSHKAMVFKILYTKVKASELWSLHCILDCTNFSLQWSNAAIDNSKGLAVPFTEWICTLGILSVASAHRLLLLQFTNTKPFLASNDITVWVNWPITISFYYLRDGWKFNLRNVFTLLRHLSPTPLNLHQYGREGVFFFTLHV